MMTFLLFAPASTRWLRWRTDRKSWRDRLGRFCDIYCTVILRYSFVLRVISDILWSSCFESYGLKDTRQALYNCVYTSKHLESLPDMSSQIFDWKDTLSLSFQSSVENEALENEDRSTKHEMWVLRFRDLGASCFDLRFRVLRFRNYLRERELIKRPFNF